MVVFIKSCTSLV